MNEASRRRLLLVGAGHAHLEVLRRLGAARPPDLETTVLTLDPRHYYSGMTPGYLAGRYTLEEMTVDVPAIARRAGATCIIGAAAELDPARRRVRLQNGLELTYDLVSLNVGSLTAGAECETARAAEWIKPLHRVTRLKQRLDALAETSAGGMARVVVVGAGAGGVEVAFAAATALERGGRAREITLVDRRPNILGRDPAPFRALVEHAVRLRGIRVRLGVGEVAVEPQAVRLGDGLALPSDLTVWVTGPEGAGLLAASGLPVCSLGFLLVDDTLRSIGDPRVFAAGDCATLTGYPGLPKSGVYAVREAPVLWRNLLASVRHEALMPFRPQRHALSILNTCDGRALLRYGRLRAWSRWAWWLKDRIDRRYIRAYQRAGS